MAPDHDPGSDNNQDIVASTGTDRGIDDGQMGRACSPTMIGGCRTPSTVTGGQIANMTG